MKNEREERARAVLLAIIGRNRLTAFGEANAIAAMLAFADDELERAKEGLDHFGWDETAGKAVFRAMKGDEK